MDDDEESPRSPALHTPTYEALSSAGVLSTSPVLQALQEQARQLDVLSTGPMAKAMQDYMDRMNLLSTGPMAKAVQAYVDRLDVLSTGPVAKAVQEYVDRLDALSTGPMAKAVQAYVDRLDVLSTGPMAKAVQAYVDRLDALSTGPLAKAVQAYVDRLDVLSTGPMAKAAQEYVDRINLLSTNYSESIRSWRPNGLDRLSDLLAQVEASRQETVLELQAVDLAADRHAALVVRLSSLNALVPLLTFVLTIVVAYLQYVGGTETFEEQQRLRESLIAMQQAQIAEAERQTVHDAEVSTILRTIADTLGEIADQAPATDPETSPVVKKPGWDD